MGGGRAKAENRKQKDTWEDRAKRCGKAVWLVPLVLTARMAGR